MTEGHGGEEETREFRARQAATEGPWLKWGVILSLATMVLTYLGIAYAAKWPPFSLPPPPRHGVAPRPVPNAQSPASVPKIAYQRHQWYAIFTVYAPNGIVIASSD